MRFLGGSAKLLCIILCLMYLVSSCAPEHDLLCHFVHKCRADQQCDMSKGCEAKEPSSRLCNNPCERKTKVCHRSEVGIVVKTCVRDVYGCNIWEESSCKTLEHCSDSCKNLSCSSHSQCKARELCINQVCQPCKDGHCRKEVWAKSFGSNGFEEGNTIGVDRAGNIFITGSFTSQQLRLGTFVLQQKAVYTRFVAKVDPFGSFLWVVPIWAETGEKTVSITSLVVDKKDGSVMFAGSFTKGKLQIGTQSFSGKHANNGFFTKFTSKGEFRWIRTLDGDSFVSSLALGRTNELIFSGRFRGTLTLDTKKKSSKGEWDIFLVKTTISETQDQQRLFRGGEWFLSGGGELSDNVSKVVVDEERGYIYLSGRFESKIMSLGRTSLKNPAALLNKRFSEAFVLGFTREGKPLWSTSFSLGFHGYIADMVVDSDGKVLLTGSIGAGGGFQHPDFKRGTVADMFLVKYQDQGNIEWIKSFQSARVDSGDAIVAGMDGTIYLAGYQGKNRLHGEKKDPRYYLAKLDRNGRVLWEQNLSTLIRLAGLALDSKGYLIQVGRMIQDNANPTDIEIGSKKLVNQGFRDLLLMKFGPTGELP